MTREILYLFDIKDGIGTIRGRRGFLKDVQGMKDGKYVLALRKYRKSRTNKQNSYYHSCVVPSVMEGLIDAGFSKSSLSLEIVHEMLKQKFLQEDIATEDGVYISITKSTSELTTTEFMDYIAEIQKWAAEFLSIVIEDPNEQRIINFK